MPEKERNALAELANRLDTRKSKDFIVRVDAHDVSLARRIVAELAKVKGYNDHGQTYMIYRDETQTAYEKCRVIAEEGDAK